MMRKGIKEKNSEISDKELNEEMRSRLINIKNNAFRIKLENADATVAALYMQDLNLADNYINGEESQEQRVLIGKIIGIKSKENLDAYPGMDLIREIVPRVYEAVLGTLVLQKPYAIIAEIAEGKFDDPQYAESLSCVRGVTKHFNGILKENLIQAKEKREKVEALEKFSDSLQYFENFLSARQAGINWEFNNRIFPKLGMEMQREVESSIIQADIENTAGSKQEKFGDSIRRMESIALTEETEEKDTSSTNQNPVFTLVTEKQSTLENPDQEKPQSSNLKPDNEKDVVMEKNTEFHHPSARNRNYSSTKYLFK